MFTAVDIFSLIALGMVAGTLGGLLGIGGSMIMIPVLTLFLGRDQHLSQATAMIVNVFVAAPAAWQHHRNNAVRWDVFRVMLPVAAVAILIGVAASNQLDGSVLRRIFGAFLLYMVVLNVTRLIRGRPQPSLDEQRTGAARTGSVGGIMGFMAGLLGIGGGGIAVPLMQRVCHLPLRQSIATSSAVMCLSAGLGAIHKNASLAMNPALAGADSAGIALESLAIAGVLIPTAIVGGLLGSTLTHRLPLTVVQVVFILLLSWVSLQMLGLV